MHRHTALSRAAAAGNARAQYAYGITLLITEEGKINRPEKAYPWLLAAAKQGLPNAQALVALCLHRGWGVEPDEKAAVEWYRKAILRGQSGAAMQLAAHPAAGASSKDVAEWLETALSQGRGTSSARLALASLYLSNKEYKKAVQQLRFAALEGNAEAAYLMAKCYEEGTGVPKDANLMRGWLQNAADMGHAPAAERLRAADAPKAKSTPRS